MSGALCKGKPAWASSTNLSNLIESVDTREKLATKADISQGIYPILTLQAEFAIWEIDKVGTGIKVPPHHRQPKKVPFSPGFKGGRGGLLAIRNNAAKLPDILPFISVVNLHASVVHHHHPGYKEAGVAVVVVLSHSRRPLNAYATDCDCGHYDRRILRRRFPRIFSIHK